MKVVLRVLAVVFILLVLFWIAMELFFQGLKVALLAQIALAHNASANVTPAGLITAGKCFACFADTDVGKIMELQLLVIIAT
jgi:hypothetical protein